MSVPRDTTTPRSRRSGVAPPPGGAPAALPSADNDADADIATPGGARASGSSCVAYPIQVL